jgi:hypothetical protein
MEITLKLADKIKQKERFSVYIVIPMWPEGVLSSTATQRILFCQVSFYDHLECYHRLEFRNHKNLYWKVIMVKKNICFSNIDIKPEETLKFVCFVSSNSNDFNAQYIIWHHNIIMEL